MIAAFVAEDVGVVEFGIAIFIALVVGVLIWNVVFLVIEAIQDRSRSKVASRVNDTSAKIVVNND
jgi:cytochrome b subunit of formate dehydrogenase